MPFKDGTWNVPTPAEISEFTDKLVNSGAYEQQPEMPDSIKQQLMRYASLGEIQNKYDSNKKKYNTALALATNEKMVSIIVPIYGALHMVKTCVKAIFKRTHWPYELILIDDASPDSYVGKWLDELSEDRPAACKSLIKLKNAKNRGFPGTVNRGMRLAQGHYLCILNSDVIVTDKWLVKLVLALEADETHVIVNPATNNTALVNIPMLPGKSYLSMNRSLERSSAHTYPTIMPTGFCFMFRKELTKKIGLFDEGFVNGYGEESSFFMNAIKLSSDSGQYMRYKAVMADDCYVFHERGSSFSAFGNEQHMGMRKAGNDRFHMLHPEYRENWAPNYSATTVITPFRTELPAEFYNHIYKYNIAYVVKSPKFCGGMKFISDIVNELLEKNVNAIVCVIKNPDADEDYLGELHTAPVFFENEDDFLQTFESKVFNSGIIIAAVTELIPPVEKLTVHNNGLVGFHHIQSYDPALVLNDKEMAQTVAAQYGRLPFSIISSKWIHEALNLSSSEMILPGINYDLFHKGDRNKGDDRFTVLIPMIPKYWFKGCDRAIALAKELFRLFDENNEELRVIAYGVQAVPDVPRMTCLGELSQARVASLLQKEVDIFVEPSYVHSYGMPAAEALACGVRVFSWNNRGIHDVSDVGISVFGNDATPKEIADAIYKFKDDAWHPFSAPIPDRNDAVASFIDKVEKQYSLQSKEYRINIVTPHARKHGGPTTIINLANILQHLGHKVRLITNYQDFNPSVIALCNTPMFTSWTNPPECDLLIINSDNPFAEEMMANAPNAKKVMLKLSHNARFKSIEEDNLRLPHWNHILTSTDIMANAAMKCQENWRHIEWPKDKVDRLGWYHYMHPQFNCPPQNRTWGNINTKFILGTLIHAHPLKGSSQVVAIMEAFKKKYGDNVVCVGVGECVMKPKPEWLTYVYKATRDELASVFRQIDVWIGASHTEGLGRMPLELMSAGAVIVNSDTGTEFLEHEKNSLLYPIGNAQACANHVQRLLKDQELFTNLSLAGYETAIRYSNATPYVNNVAFLINKIMEKQ
jgi:GT2 family glycosyltransferase